MIKLGNNSIGKIYLGSNSIGKAYLGSNLVFQKGSSPTPPTPVIEPVFYDRLVFDGTAYIDTDIIPPADCSFRIVIGGETQKKAQRYFYAATENSGYIGVTLGSSTTSATRYFSVYYGSDSVVSSNRTLSFSYSEFTLFLTPKRFGWGSDAASITKGSSAPSGPVIVGSSPSHSGNAFTGRIGAFRIYGSDAQNATSASDLSSNYTPVYTLIPCTYNGDAGLWCVETSKFYGNTAGAGTLTVINNS